MSVTMHVHTYVFLFIPLSIRALLAFGNELWIKDSYNVTNEWMDSINLIYNCDTLECVAIIVSHWY